MNTEVTGKIIVRQDRLRPFVERHPWVRATAVELVEGNPPDGGIVDLVTRDGRFIARGLYNSRSQIRVRLYTWQDVPLNREFWRDRIHRAVTLRNELGLITPQGAARLVFSEADGLSGLIVDKYGPYLVVQTNALGLEQRSSELLEILEEVIKPRGIVHCCDPEVREQEGLTIERAVHGTVPDGPILIEEHGIQYGVDLLMGQKTGFYLDQRENRRVAAQWTRDKRVLDMFCYTGGFALCAAKLGRAREVWGYDSSEKAIILARANAEHNAVPRARFEVGDAFEVLKELRERGERFDVVILDPPKFASGKAKLPEALRAYHFLNRMAVELIPPGGYLITCSCSGYVTREDFFNVIFGVAQQTRRDIQILEQRGAGADHPVSVTCRETNYLKCFICRVL